jgi:3-deoxy-D-manno-octulosonic-acid transferase
LKANFSRCCEASSPTQPSRPLRIEFTDRDARSRPTGMSTLIRSVYSLFMTLAQPLLRRKLARRAVAEPGYAVAVEERFGHYSAPAGSGYVWIHAVSLGETRTAAILLKELRHQMPGMRLLLTHGTATGRAEGMRLLQPGDVQVWQPWDTPAAVARFLAHFQPRIGVLMETEVWPNLVAGCQQAGVPLVLANARLSDKSLKKALRLAWLARPAYAALTAAYAQTDGDAQRLRQLGAKVDGVFGNLKFDATPDQTLLAQGRRWRETHGRPVVMLASSREGEEQQFLEVLRSNGPQVLFNRTSVAMNSIAVDAGISVQWLIVPRHPQRFDAVAALIRDAGFTVSRRSMWSDGPPAGDVDADTVWLGDSLGEMPLYYALADVALLGGSFVPVGGQNLIEAAACGCPVVMGPSTFNFAEPADQAEALGAAVRVEGIRQGVAIANALVGNVPRLVAIRRACTVFFAGADGAGRKTGIALYRLLAY